VKPTVFNAFVMMRRMVIESSTMSIFIDAMVLSFYSIIDDFHFLYLHFVRRSSVSICIFAFTISIGKETICY